MNTTSSNDLTFYQNGGYWCSCGIWVPNGSFHYCQLPANNGWPYYVWTYPVAPVKTPEQEINEGIASIERGLSRLEQIPQLRKRAKEVLERLEKQLDDNEKSK